MNLVIKGTQYTLNFGFKFLRTIDETLPKDLKTDGITPLDAIVLQLGMEDISVVPLVAAAALTHLGQAPGPEAIEEALEALAAELGPEETLCKVFTEALRTAPLLTASVEKMAGVATQMQEMQKKMIAKSMNELAKN